MNKERIFKVIRGPHVTEKSANAGGESNQVVFKVACDASKLEIKKAVEHLFEVVVEDVRVLSVKGKTRRTRNGVGRRSDWKKAYVRLSADSDIDFAIVD